MAKQAARPRPTAGGPTKSSGRAPESTWGVSRRAKAAASAKPATSAKPAAGRTKVADPTPVRDVLRRGANEAMGEQRHEFIGLGLIFLGLLLSLAVYLRVAGPVGSGIADALGWTVGLGRSVVPVACIVAGVALIRRRHTGDETRLVIGWTFIAVAVLGLMHLARGADHLTASLGLLQDAGGWVGAVIAQPLRKLIADAGAFIVLLCVLAWGVMLVTRSSVRDVASTLVAAVKGVTSPVGSAARRAYGEVSTLQSERTAEHLRSPAPALYDADRDATGAHPPLTAPPTGPAMDGPDPKPAKGRKASAKPAVFDGPLDPVPTEQPELDLGPGAQKGQWKLPPLSFLNRSEAQSVDMKAVIERGDQLVAALKSHQVETTRVGQTVGPTVTRYELELGEGVKVARITSLQRDIAYAMAATDVRILAPIPGRKAIGIEVPNHERQLVALGDNMASAEAKAATHPLDVAIGKDIAGRSVFLNLATTPHLLIAGATGAGKSSGINCIITSILMRTTPEQVRLILIDPKQVEMGQYNRLPHLLTQPVTNPKKAANALSWAVKEMERRYDLLFEVGFRDIGGYNSAFDRGELVPEPGTDTTFERLPFIVVVVDELNDLMMVAARDVEESITRIAQKARAVGIHLIVATQRPSVNVITGVIKANVPARMAFAVSSLTDSRVILDQPGAEKLVGKGDMLLLPGNSSVAQRIQGCFVSEEEVRKVVGFWRKQAPEVVYVSGVEGDEGSPGGSSSAGGYGGNGDDDDDETLVRQAMDLIVRSQLGSTSMLQRKLKVGFARAGRIMDLLEQRGVVGPSEGSKARAVLMTVEELELIQNAERGG